MPHFSSKRFWVILIGVLLVAGLTGVLPTSGRGSDAVRAASFGPQLYLLSPSPDQAEVLPTLPATVHAVLYSDGPERYVASGGPDLLDQATAKGIPVRLLDADTAGKSYYFADAQADDASAQAGQFGTVIYGDAWQLLLAAPTDNEAALVETLPAHGVGLALLSPDAIALEPAASPTPEDGSPGRTSAGESPDPAVEALLAQVSPQAISDRIADLSGERPADIGGSTATLATRYTFAPAIRNAEAYLYQRYVNLGIPVSYASWTYSSYSGRNVVAEIRGSVHPERVWLVGGHFDDTSESPYTRAPGADDNASGTAATLVIAAILRAHGFGDTIRFVHFSAEEQGHWGSQVYARSLSSAGAQVMGYINLDMIGWDGDGDRTVEIHSGTRANSVDLASRFTAASQRYGQGLRVEVKGSSASRFSDHSSFWDFGYPAFMAIENFFDDAIPRDRNPWYHQTGDLLSRVNLDYVVRSTRTALAMLAEGAGLDPAPAPTATPTNTGAVPSPSATPTPAAAACTELVANGGFEANASWSFAVTASTGGYTTAQAHFGARSARLGVLPTTPYEAPAQSSILSGAIAQPSIPSGAIAQSKHAPPGAPPALRAGQGVSEVEGDAASPQDPPAPERNLLGELAPLGASYSTAYQTITIPASARTVTLTFWQRPGTQATGGDFQRVLLLRPGTYSLITTVMKTLANAASWQQTAFDLTPYRGQSIVLYFEVYNDDITAGPRTWMFVDDVSAQACSGAVPSPTATLTAAPTATATSTPTRTNTPTLTPSPTPGTPAPTMTVTPSPTASPSATATPTHTATPAPTPTLPASCSERVANGGFEANASWAFAVTASTGGYTTTQAHSGARSARLGVVPSTAGAAQDHPIPGDFRGEERNLLGELAIDGASYSTAYQTVVIPADADTAMLTFWYQPGTQATGGDFQRVLLLRPGSYSLLATLMKTLINAGEWQLASFDLSGYRGRSVAVYFEVYNDNISAGPRTWMFVDDVSIRACTSHPGRIAPSDVQPGVWLPLLMVTIDQ